MKTFAEIQQQYNDLLKKRDEIISEMTAELFRLEGEARLAKEEESNKDEQSKKE